MKKLIGLIVLGIGGVVVWDVFEDGKLDLPDQIVQMGILPGYGVGMGVATGVGDSIKGMAGRLGGN